MRIDLEPQRRADTLTISRTGDVLTVNGVEFDFTALEDDSEIPVDAIDSDWFTGSGVRRVGGVLYITLILPHGSHCGEDARFPEPIVDPADGPVTIPLHTLPGIPPP